MKIEGEEGEGEEEADFMLDESESPIPQRRVRGVSLLVDLKFASGRSRRSCFVASPSSSRVLHVERIPLSRSLHFHE